MGLFGYDLVRTVERLAEPNPDPVGTPDMALMVSDALIVFDHLSHRVTILVNAFVDDGADVDEAYAGAPPRPQNRLPGSPPPVSAAPTGRGTKRPLVLTMVERDGPAVMKRIESHSTKAIEEAL